MMFMLTSFYKYVNRRSRDPSDLTLVLRVAGRIAAGCRAHAGGNRGGETTTVRSCHYGVQEGNRTGSVVCGWFHQPGPGLHGERRLRVCDSSAETCVGTERRFAAGASIAGVCPALAGLRERSDSTSATLA